MDKRRETIRRLHRQLPRDPGADGLQPLAQLQDPLLPEEARRAWRKRLLTEIEERISDAERKR